MNSPDTLADSVVALGIAASTDEVNKCLVMTDDDQLKVFLVLTALSEIAKTSKPSLISDLCIIHVALNLEMAFSLNKHCAIESMHNTDTASSPQPTPCIYPANLVPSPPCNIENMGVAWGRGYTQHFCAWAILKCNSIEEGRVHLYKGIVHYKKDLYTLVT